MRPGKVPSTKRGVAGRGPPVPAKTAFGFVHKVASFSDGRSSLLPMPGTPHPQALHRPEGPLGQLFRGCQADSLVSAPSSFKFPCTVRMLAGTPKF